MAALVPVLLLPMPLCAADGGAGTTLREGRWEVMIHAEYWNDTDVDFGGGASADLDSTYGLGFGFGYNFSEQLALHVNITANSVDYRARGVDASGVTRRFSGEIDTVSTQFDLSYYFLRGRVTPFVSGGVGWTWVDTNIPSGPPVTGCWWDPWWGYICYPTQPTYNSTETAYNVAAGMRWELSRETFLRAGIGRHWVDYDGASGTPGVYLVRVSLGFKF